ncbi:ComF family protein [Pannonibacter tanglangensis]|nr:ComF family protein [Pannonibacter sp. XCT-53]
MSEFARSRLRPALGMVLSGLRRTLVAGFDVLLPPRCPVCEAVTADNGSLCPECWTRMPFISAPWCARLGTPLSHDLGEGALSARAIAEPPLFDRARAATLYQGPARDLVLALKFGGRRDVAGVMGRLMAGNGREILTPETLLVPVPLHRFRLWQRRFNQAALLARAVGAASGVPVVLDALERRRRTRQQVGLTARERHANVRGAFAVPDAARPRLLGRPVVLVDDVLTTGSTLSACTRVLRQAGASRVDVLTFAIADPVTNEL